MAATLHGPLTSSRKAFSSLLASGNQKTLGHLRLDDLFPLSIVANELGVKLLELGQVKRKILCCFHAKVLGPKLSSVVVSRTEER